MLPQPSGYAALPQPLIHNFWLYLFAQAILGLMYDTGQGVPQDYAEAVKWYRLDAERGYASAQYILKIWSHGSDSNRRPAVYECVECRPALCRFVP